MLAIVNYKVFFFLSLTIFKGGINREFYAACTPVNYSQLNIKTVILETQKINKSRDAHTLHILLFCCFPEGF